MTSLQANFLFQQCEPLWAESSQSNPCYCLSAYSLLSSPCSKLSLAFFCFCLFAPLPPSTNSEKPQLPFTTLARRQTNRKRKQIRTNEWGSRPGPKPQPLHVTFCSGAVAVASAGLKKNEACASLNVSSRTVLRVTVCVNCIVVRVSRTDGSQSTWLLKRTISVKVKEKKKMYNWNLRKRFP